MKISLMDIFYTGGMIFVAFYAALFITKFLAKDIIEDEEDGSEK